MWNRAKTSHHLPKASWQRELLRPLLISLAPVAYMITQLDLPGEDTFLLVIFLMIGIGFLPLLIPQQMVGGSKLHRPSPPHQDVPEPSLISPLQRMSNGDYGPKFRDDYEDNILLPEIDTAPSWVQWLIATFGRPGLLAKLPRIVGTLMATLLFVAFCVGYLVLLWWLHANTLSSSANIWTIISFTILTLTGAYRRAFRRLHDIYTADAAKTGRYAFPALRR